MPQVSIRSPAGTPLQKIFRPFSFQPPSTFSILLEPASQSAPPVETRIRFSAATRRRSGSGALLPARQL